MEHLYCSIIHKWHKNGKVDDVSFKCENESKSLTHMCKEVQSFHYCMNIKKKKTPFQSQHGSHFKQNLPHRQRTCFYRKILSTVKKKKFFKFVSLFESELSMPPSVHSQALLASRRCGFCTRGPEDFIIPSSLPLPALPHSLSLPHSTPFISSSFRCTCIPATVNVPSSIFSFVNVFFHSVSLHSEMKHTNTKLKILRCLKCRKKHVKCRKKGNVWFCMIVMQV